MTYSKIFIMCLSCSISFAIGQSFQDIQKLKSEFEKIKNSSDNTPNLRMEIDNSLDSDRLPNTATVTKYKSENQNVNKRLDSFFGYTFFTKRDTVSFWENLPAPSNYILGPGDEVILSIWGQTQIRQSYFISKDGKIYDDKVGLLNISGKTINESKIYLKNQFGRVYSTLVGNSPSSFIDVSIGQLRSININLVGQVNFPGIFPVHPFSTLITGLIQAGGVDTTGSLRNIEIIRNGKLYEVVDLYKFFISGSSSKNIQLRDQDVVVIPPRRSYVKIDSAVVRPGIYEHMEGETIFDMIQIAGGAKYNSSGLVSVKSILPRDQRTEEKNQKIEYFTIEETKLKKILPNDEINLLFIKNQESFVKILGQVKKPGVYNFYEGMMLSNLLELSSGFADSAFFKSVFKERGQIIRKRQNERYEEIITFDLTKVVNDSIDFKLSNYDKVIIHPNLNYFEREYVTIVGEVNIPGKYPLTRDNESLRSMINRAGGFTEKSFIEGIEVFRDSLRVAWNNMSLEIFPGDSIFVKERPGTIIVRGEVYNPGLIEFDNSRSLRDYINLAGGPTKNGDKKDIIVIFANGEVAPKRVLFSPKIREGSVIIINAKRDENDQFNPGEFANNFLSLTSSIVTILILIQQLNN